MHVASRACPFRSSGNDHINLVPSVSLFSVPWRESEQYDPGNEVAILLKSMYTRLCNLRIMKLHARYARVD